MSTFVEKLTELARTEVLFANMSSKFYALCEAAGKQEFRTLKEMIKLGSRND